MSLIDDMEKLYRGWGDKPAHPNSPSGGGGSGAFSQSYPLCTGDSSFLKLPHPYSPACKQQIPQDITKAFHNRFQVSTTNILRKGIKSPEVRIVQKKLQEYGYQVSADGDFGSKTDSAVRAFQRKKGLLPDGIVGLKTLHALGISDKTGITFVTHNHYSEFIKLIGEFIGEAASLAKKQPVTSLTSSPAKKLHISDKGLQFIYNLEALRGVSNHLHWPKGASGVTLGPGYDMKERIPSSIIADMTAIGLDLDRAKKIAEAAGKKGSDAQKFVIDNKKLVNLTKEQEMQLLIHVVPPYEKIVHDNITVDLVQHEFDALVSFAYNPGGQFTNVAKNINQGKITEAMTTIKSVVKSGGVVMSGLVTRREKEVSLYLYGTSL